MISALEKENQTVSATEIAHFILHFFQVHEDPITNSKLQKLLYYVQGWHLALFDKPVFDEEFEAWIHGPVISSVFNTYKHNRWSPIVEEVSPVTLPNNLKEHIDEVLEVYGGDTGWALEMRVHKEAPWMEARQGIPIDEASTEIISKQAMQAFFKKEGER